MWFAGSPSRYGKQLLYLFVQDKILQETSWLAVTEHFRAIPAKIRELARENFYSYRKQFSLRKINFASTPLYRVIEEESLFPPVALVKT